MNKFLIIFACVVAVCNAGYGSPASYGVGYGSPIDAQALNLAAVALGLPAPAGGPLVQPIANLYGAVPVVARAPLLAPAPVLAAPVLAAAPVVGRPSASAATSASAAAPRIVSPAYSPLPGLVAGPVYANPAVVAAPAYRGAY